VMYAQNSGTIMYPGSVECQADMASSARAMPTYMGFLLRLNTPVATIELARLGTIGLTDVLVRRNCTTPVTATAMPRTKSAKATAR